jgi:recombination protein RecA
MTLSPVENFKFEVAPPTYWTLSEVAGRLVEISGSRTSASLTVVTGLIREAQERGEPVGWATWTESFFYPPDVAQAGVDLAALVIIRVPKRESIARAGEKLLRSGGFGLVVLDLGVGDIPMPLQTRLAGLTHQYHAALICLTAKEGEAFSLSSLISLRLHAGRKRTTEGRFTCDLRALKDKRHGPTWTHEELCHGAAGLC